MPYLDHRDDLAGYSTSSSTESDIYRHAPRRPPQARLMSPDDRFRRQSAAQATSGRVPRRAEQHDRHERTNIPYDPSDSSPRDQCKRDDRYDRRSIGRSQEGKNGKPRLVGTDREARRERRMERRKSRAAQNPEREARRQERRQQRRQERAAQYSDPDLEHDERRRASRASRADRNASPRKSAQVRETDLYPRQNNVSSRPAKRNSFEADYLEHMSRSPQNQDEADRPAYVARTETWHSSGDDWSADLENSYLDEKHSRSTSMYDELQWYKRGINPDDRDRYRNERDERRSCCAGRRRCCIVSLVAAVISLIIIIVVPVIVSRNSYSYTPSTAQVNNTAAFIDGGATRNSVNDTKDGIGAGTDTYRYYRGDSTQFPNQSAWISFEDMWSKNLATIQQACGWLHYGDNDSDEEIQDIYNAIQDRANASLVDHRLILALVMQESHGCVNIPHTTSFGGIRNTGLMQAHNGAEFDSHHSSKSILQMIQDGTQGTDNGPGLVQLLNQHSGNPYVAARWYNSGQVAANGDLSDGAGATSCYVSDVANRLTGWVQATSTCPGDG